MDYLLSRDICPDNNQDDPRSVFVLTKNNTACMRTTKFSISKAPKSGAFVVACTLIKLGKRVFRVL